MNRAYSILEIKAVDEDARVIEGIASTPTPDRVGDIVEPMGAKFTLPMPLLWQHRSSEPVGHVTFAKPNKSGIPFKAKIEKTDEPGRLKDRLDEAWQSVKLKLVRAVSIGFSINAYEILKEGGWRINEWEWLELSLVTIPANAEATITTIRSIDADLLAAAGHKQNGSERTVKAGVTASRKPVKAMEPRTMKKTIAEQIAAFETTRTAKSARMTEIMDAAAEKGETLDSAQKEEYDALDVELKEIDDHLTRLREHERRNKAAATTVEKIDDPARASEVRAGVRVESVKANVAKGIPFTRYALALAMAKGNRMEALEIAKNNKTWHDQTPEVETVLKAAVAAGTTTDTTWAAPLVEYQVMASEFIEYLRPRTIIGRIAGLRRVPFKIKVPRQTAVASVGWVGEGKPKPVGRGALDSVTLDFFKIAGIIVLTDELVRFSNPSAEALAREDLAGGVIQLMDSDFIDPDKAEVANVSPASITWNVDPRIASGTDYAALVADSKVVMDNFLAANITPDFVVMSQSQAWSFSMMENSLGQRRFPDLTLEGGTFMGLPAITSQNLPDTEDSPAHGKPIIFGRANEIMLADDGQVMIDVSREASLQMNDAPDDPVTASTVLVSLWQQNMVGIRAERMVNWKKRRAAAVQYISGARYTTG